MENRTICEPIRSRLTFHPASSLTSPPARSSQRRPPSLHDEKHTRGATGKGGCLSGMKAADCDDHLLRRRRDDGTRTSWRDSITKVDLIKGSHFWTISPSFLSYACKERSPCRIILTIQMSISLKFDWLSTHCDGGIALLGEMSKIMKSIRKEFLA